MAKRIKIFFPDGENQIEVYEDQLESYLNKGFKADNKPKKKNSFLEKLSENSGGIILYIMNTFEHTILFIFF